MYKIKYKIKLKIKFKYKILNLYIKKKSKLIFPRK